MNLSIPIGSFLVGTLQIWTVSAEMTMKCVYFVLKSGKYKARSI